MTTVTITVDAPEAHTRVQVDRDTVTLRELCGHAEVTPTPLEVLDEAVARARAVYAASRAERA